MLRFEEALERHRKRRLTAEEAGELLGMSGRHFRRLMVRYDEDGLEGLRDQRLGKPSLRRAPEAELARMRRLYQELYGDFTMKHFHEQLQKRHGYKLCYTVTRLALQAAGLAAKTKRGGPHRKKRERRPPRSTARARRESSPTSTPTGSRRRRAVILEVAGSCRPP